MEWSDPLTEFFDAQRAATAFEDDRAVVVVVVAMALSGKS